MDNGSAVCIFNSITELSRYAILPVSCSGIFVLDTPA